MSNLSVNVATHALLLKDGSKKFINKGAYEIIWKKFIDGEKEILINDWMISTDKISEIISMEEFKQRFPDVDEDLIPAPKLKSLEQLESERGLGLKGVIEKYKDDNFALKEMIKGIKRYISSTEENPIVNWRGDKRWWQGTNAPVELLEKMEDKLKARS